ncbi:MAG: DUF3990 domain-containing protein [Lachnospiraceae bacterium]|nr:DUF3990 domain-containing protein [Lachnospiraceae bacterium]
MTKKIYHGSEKVIQTPVYHGGKAYNDYGYGFYCTENINMAKEWGVDRDRDGCANIYNIECEGLSILDLNSSNYTILHWLTILLQNRQFNIPSGLAMEAKKYLISQFSIDYEAYDIIKGYRADDCYFSFAQDFINGTISYSQLGEAMHLGKLGQQFVIKSKKAFERIEFVNFEVAERSMWYPRKKERDSQARREYFRTDRNNWHKGEIYITHILDEEMKADDIRLR